jgi:hypothetical protein
MMMVIIVIIKITREMSAFVRNPFYKYKNKSDYSFCAGQLSFPQHM